MNALSIKRPWGPLICAGLKDIENRTRCLPSTFETPQRILIHLPRRDDPNDQMEWLMGLGLSAMIVMLCYASVPWPKSSIVGEVTITDCVQESDSPWFKGPHGFTLTDAIKYEVPIPCPGRLGFWTPPDDVLAKVREGMVAHG